MRSFTTADGLPSNDIRALRVEGDRLWIGTDRGLALFEQDRFRRWTIADGLPALVVSAIDTDHHSGDVWIGTMGGGLARLSAGRFDQFDQLNSGLAGSIVFDVLVHRDHVYAVTNGGLSAYKPASDTWDLHFERRADAPEVAIHRLQATATGLVAAAWRGGLYRQPETGPPWVALHPDRVALAAAPGEESLAPSYEESLGLIVENDGKCWWVWRDRLLEWDQVQSWMPHVLPRVGGSSPFVLDAVSGFGALWLATDHGLLRFAQEAPEPWHHYQIERESGPQAPARAADPVDSGSGREAPHDGCVITVEVDAHRGLWIGTDSGLLLATIESTPHAAGTARPISLESGAAATRGRAMVAGHIRTFRMTPNRTPIRTMPANQSVTAPDFSSPRATPGIGIFGPRARTMTLPGGAPFESPTGARADLLAVQLAVESQHRHTAGAMPTISLVAYTKPALRYGWGLPEDDFGTFISRGDVTGIVGSLCARNPITELAILRTRIPFVNAAPLPEIESWPVAPHAWWFPCWDDRPALLMAVLGRVAEVHAIRRPLIIDGNHWAEQWHARQWLAAAVRKGFVDVPMGRLASADILLDASTGRPMTQELMESFDAAFMWADARHSIQLMNVLQNLNAKLILVGSPSLLEPACESALAGFEPAIYAVVPTSVDRSCLVDELHRPYAERNVIGGRAEPPDSNAVRSFLAADHLLAAVQAVGADREAVRRLLQADQFRRSEHHRGRFGPSGAFSLTRYERGTWVPISIARAPSGAGRARVAPAAPSSAAYHD